MNIHSARPSRSPRLHLLCARFWPDRHGGVEQRMWHVSRQMARSGRAVTVWTENRVGAATSEELAPNLLVRRIDPFDPGRLWRWRELPRVRWWTRVIRQGIQPGEPIWATDPTMAVAAVFAGRSGELLYNPAGCVASMRQVGRAHPAVDSMKLPRRLQWLDRFGYRAARCVVVSSKNVAEQLTTSYGRRGGVAVIPHGVEPPADREDRALVRRRLGIDPQAFVVGFVGRLDPCKGLDHLFHALSGGELGSRGMLLVVGDGAERERLEQLADDLGLSGRVLWTGAMRDPAPAYLAMDVMVLPSVYEAFGNVLVEAMSRGVPVVARRSNHKEVRTAAEEIIDSGRTGLIADPLDPGDLGRKIRWLAKHGEERERMGAAARQAALKRPWSVVVDEYACLIDRHLPYQWSAGPADGWQPARAA